METVGQQFLLLGGAYQRFIDIGQRKGAARKHDLVVARRLVSQQLLDLENLIKNAPSDAVEPALARECGKRLAHVRSAISLHHASWPAVRLDEDPTAYNESAMTAHKAYNEFIEWGIRTFRK